MEIIRSSHDLMDRIEKLSKDNSVCQVFIPGKGQLTIVLQGNELGSIAAEVNADPELRLMIDDSREAYQKGKSLTTTELLKSMSAKDFAQ